MSIGVAGSRQLHRLAAPLLAENAVKLLLGIARDLEVIVERLRPLGIDLCRKLEGLFPRHQPGADVLAREIGATAEAAFDVFGVVMHAGHAALDALIPFVRAL